MPKLPRGPPGAIPAHCRPWHRCWSSSVKPRSTITQHRRAMCLISRSQGPTPWVRGNCGGWESVCLGVSTLGLCICSLLERRDMWRQEAEARQHSQPDPAMPPGHTCMPENQRLETLNSLLQSEYLGKGGRMGSPLGTMHLCPVLTVPGPL